MSASVGRVASFCQRLLLCGYRPVAREMRAGTQRGLVVNARVDSFLSPSFTSQAAALEEAVLRAKVYSEAGADCIYPIGPGDEKSVRELRARITAPINILGSHGAAPLSVLKEIGVNRVSFGPFVFRSCLRKFVDIAADLMSTGDYASFSDMLSKTETEAYVRDEHE